MKYVCPCGYEYDPALGTISHDGLVYNGFRADAHLREDNPYTPIFERLLPAMREVGFTEKEIKGIMTDNPKNMLLCQ